MHGLPRNQRRARALARPIARSAMLLLVLFGTASGQSLTKETPASSGTTMSWAGGSLTMTIGETAGGHMANAGTTIHTGFLPPPRALVSAAIDRETVTGLRVFPLPAREHVNVVLPALPELSLELCDVFGRQHLVQRNIAGRVMVDLEGIPPGGYFLRVFSGLESVHTEMIMVIR